jgi:hypothetical protein
MPGRKSSATARKSFTEHWAAVGDLICEAIYGGSGTAEPIESIVDTKGKAIPKAAASKRTGIRKGAMTKAMLTKLVASGEETYESARDKALGGECYDCATKWAQNDSKRGGPDKHTC